MIKDSNLKIALVIPARYQSSRFPGKPLAPIIGIPLLERVWRIAMSLHGVSEVLIATDDERIARFAETLGTNAVMTSPTCRNGTERVLECLEIRGVAFSHVINFQGDAVLTPPWVIQSLIEELEGNATLEMVTPATRMSPDTYERLRRAKLDGEVGGTTVTFDTSRNALYFSKSIIPFIRQVPSSSDFPVYRHIGLYGYRVSTLKRLVTLPMGPLEMVEELEQLRALEHGVPIRVVEVDYRGRTHWSVDSPEDVDRVEAIIQAEGEFGVFSRP